MIGEFRRNQTQLGIRKLYLDMKEDLEKRSIKMGRDGLFTFASDHDLLIRKTKLFHITTYFKYNYFKSPNLIKDILLTNGEQVFVTDKTFIKI